MFSLINRFMQIEANAMKPNRRRKAQRLWGGCAGWVAAPGSDLIFGVHTGDCGLCNWLKTEIQV